MKSLHTLTGLSTMGIAILSLSIAACAPPERGDNDYMPWGGIELDDGADDDGDDGDTEDGDDGDDDGDGDGNGDGDSGNGDDADGDGGEPPPDDDGGDPPPPDDSGEPPPDEPPESPYTGGWDIGTCQDEITATGSAVGQILPDFNLYDQYGDPVRLYDFCHKAVYIVAGAFW